MENQTVFIKRYPISGELPKCKGQTYRVYVITNNGIVYYDKYDGWEHDIEWWLEEVELPSEDDLNEKSDLKKGSSVWFHSQGFTQGANFILNKLKGDSI